MAYTLVHAFVDGRYRPSPGCCVRVNQNDTPEYLACTYEARAPRMPVIVLTTGQPTCCGTSTREECARVRDERNIYANPLREIF